MITWDVDRVILEIYGPIALRWYSLFPDRLCLGTMAFTSMAKEGKDPSLYVDTGLLYLFIGTLVGARLAHAFMNQPIASQTLSSLPNMEWWLSQSRWLFGLHDCPNHPCASI